MSTTPPAWSHFIFSEFTAEIILGIILGIGIASERKWHLVSSSLIGGAHVQDDHCMALPLRVNTLPNGVSGKPMLYLFRIKDEYLLVFHIERTKHDFCAFQLICNSVKYIDYECLNT